jgi:hypothetical protein
MCSNSKPINKENKMFTISHQTGMVEISRGLRSVRFGLLAGWPIIGLAITSLLVGLTWSYHLVRYPGAERQAVAPFQIQFQPTGKFSQHNAYQTPDDLPQVLGWYAQHLGLGHEMPQGDNCVMMTRVGAFLFLQRSFAVTLCADPTRTLIFIDRSLALR